MIYNFIYKQRTKSGDATQTDTITSKVYKQEVQSDELSEKRKCQIYETSSTSCILSKITFESMSQKQDLYIIIIYYI